MQNGITFIILLLSIFVFFTIVLSYFIHVFISPSTETPKSVRKEITNLMKIKSTDTVMDLGSGSGSILVEIAYITGAKCLGYDISPIMVFFARIRTIIHKLFKRQKLNISFEVGDFFRQDLSKGDIFYIHQPKVLLKYFEKIAYKLVKNGHRVFCYETGFPTLKPIVETKLTNGKTLFEY